MIISLDIFVQIDPENMCRTANLWLLFLSDLLLPHIDIDDDDDKEILFETKHKHIPHIKVEPIGAKASHA